MQNLAALAESLGHTLLFRSFRSFDCVTICDDSGHCTIGLDPERLGTPAEARVKLATALGHCETGALCGPGASRETRRREHDRAARWAMDCLMPCEALEAALRDGVRTPAALAARFGVTEAFAAAALRRAAPVLPPAAPAASPRKEAP